MYITENAEAGVAAYDAEALPRGAGVAQWKNRRFGWQHARLCLRGEPSHRNGVCGTASWLAHTSSNVLRVRHSAKANENEAAQSCCDRYGYTDPPRHAPTFRQSAVYGVCGTSISHRLLMTLCRTRTGRRRILISLRSGIGKRQVVAAWMS